MLKMNCFSRTKHDSTASIMKALPRDIPLQQLDILYYDRAIKRSRRYVLLSGMISMGKDGLEVFELDQGKKVRCFFNSLDIKNMKIEEVSYLEP